MNTGSMGREIMSKQVYINNVCCFDFPLKRSVRPKGFEPLTF